MDETPGPAPDPGAPAPQPAAPVPPSGWSLSRKVVVLTLAGAFGTLCEILLARYMHIYEYGSYRTVKTLIGLLLPCVTFGLVESLAHLLPRLPREAYRAVSLSTTALLLLASGIAGGGMYALRGSIAVWFDTPGLADILWIGALTLPLQAATLPVGQLLVCSNRVPLSSALGVAFSLIYALSMYLAWRLSPTPAGVLGFMACGAAAQFLIAVGVTLVTTRGQPLRFLGEELRRQWSVAWPLGLSNTINTVGGRLDQVWVGVSAGTAAFAKYWIGTAQMSFLNHLTGAINSVMIPELSRHIAAGEPDRAFRLWHIAIRRVSLIVFPLVAFLWTMAEPVLDAVFASKYAESVPIFKIACLTVLFKAVTFRALFLGSGRTQVMARGSVGFLIVNAILLFVFTRWLGARGAALAVLVGSWLLASYFTMELCWTFKRPLGATYPWRDLARSAAISALAAAVIWPLTTSWVGDLSSWTRCLAAGPTFLAAYTLLLRWTGAIEPHEWARIRAALTGRQTDRA